MDSPCIPAVARAFFKSWTDKERASSAEASNGHDDPAFVVAWTDSITWGFIRIWLAEEAAVAAAAASAVSRPFWCCSSHNEQHHKQHAKNRWNPMEPYGGVKHATLA
jgi:hypothetical protein